MYSNNEIVTLNGTLKIGKTLKHTFENDTFVSVTLKSGNNVEFSILDEDDGLIKCDGSYKIEEDKLIITLTKDNKTGEYPIPDSRTWIIIGDNQIQYEHAGVRIILK